ncbi:MAG TPA: phosphotransferase [Rhizomicrobium sp.]|jgi:hypothetical protein
MTKPHNGAHAPDSTSQSSLDILPEARRDAVRTALRAAFGAGTARAWRPISGGVSGAAILHFEIGEHPYLLRLEPERIALHNRERGFACMSAAAAVGVAPPVHYADAADGVAIMDFIANRPLTTHPAGALGLARDLGALLARVQVAPLFPDAGNYPQRIGDMLAALDATGHFAPGLLEPHREGLARIRAAYPWDTAALVSSHNDPNPRNILFDGARLWLVDWELAFRNDPLVDAAILTTEIAAAPEAEEVLLTAAFGRAPDRALRARLAVARLLTRLFYACVVLDVFVNAPDSPRGTNLDAFTQAGFLAAVADGRLKSGAQETAYAFGKMSLGAFLEGVTAPHFGELLETVRQG